MTEVLPERFRIFDFHDRFGRNHASEEIGINID